MTAFEKHAGIIARRGFTLIELLVVIAIIAILIALVLPVLGRGCSIANRSKCLAQLRQIQTACTSYAGEHDGKFPSGDREYGFPHEFKNYSITLAKHLSAPRESALFCPGELATVRNSSNSK